ncbi:amino acid adenylation domain-containing protein [Aquimarina litoralis]|uniref:amino acid adenylation domain-containing protein n=1 Tax=Aquimarina litoralis TaxID=584605 RepID=UPI0031D4FE0B
MSRTVGWFTSIYPFVLDVSTTEKRSDSLVQVKESLRKIPNKGIGYGMLKYLTDEFESSISPSIVFNYLGDFGEGIGDNKASLFEYCSDDIGLSSSSDNGQDTVLDISGMMSSGRLSMSIRYSDGLYDQATIASLIASYKSHLEILIGELSEEEQNHLTPSDVTFSNLSIQELSVLNKAGDVEDIYELSPLQQGMYYHWLSNNNTSLYFEQISYRLRAEGLEITLIKQAYDQLVERHSVLRTSFMNDYGGVPLQIVRKDIPSNFSYAIPPTGLDDQGLTEYIENSKLEDRSRGFDLEGESSQMRLKVLDLGSGSYEFIWSFHHILMDGWCISILLNDFYELMSSIDQERSVNLSTPVRYSSYIDWLNKVDKEASLDYWKGYLEDYHNIAQVPFSSQVSNEHIDEQSKEKLSLQIEGNLYEKVNTLCNDIGITQNTFIQGVWGYLLSKYNNTQDVVFGSVVSGRPAELSGVEDMIGLFSNTIPVRVKYTDSTTPLTLLKSIQESAISGTSHHYLNLSEVQSQSDLGMDLINHIMIFENFPIQEAIQEDIENTEDQKNLEITIESAEVFERINYNFNITISSTDSSITVEFIYDSCKYDKELIKVITSHFTNLLEQFSTNFNETLNSFYYLTEKETNKLLNTFNDTTVEYSQDTSLIDIFEEQVLNAPNRIAIVLEDKKLTYKELDEQSNQLAHYLIDLGIQQGELIPVCLDRSIEMIVSILAILKSGCAYLPVDHNYPMDRIDFMIEDSSAKYVLSTTAFSSLFQSKDIEPIYVDDVEYQSFSNTKTNIKWESENLIYVIYTSGSTGRPKGVMISHGALVSRVHFYKRFYQLDQSDTVLFYRSFSFDAAIEEYLLPFLTGARCVITPSNFKEDLFDNMINHIENYEVTKVNMPPILLQNIIEILPENEINRIASLKHIISGGDKLSAEVVKSFYSKVGVENKITLYNAYGPTENTNDSTILKLDRNITDKNISIGKPVENSEVYILDNECALLPLGIIGEICVAGDGISLGYLNNKELSEEKFIAHPFKLGKRLYRTGDLGRFLSDGSIAFMGRKDDQVKIRGHRIELGEIEKCLQANEEIKNAVVTIHTEANGAKELVAYLVSDLKQNMSDLRKYLSEILPEYMVPTHYIQLEEIPVTVNGKVDKKQLTDMAGTNLSSGIKYIAPRNKEEAVLVSVWESVLKRNPIGVKDSFYNLGGDSIKSIQVASRLKQQGYSLKIEHILRNPVLEDLALYVILDTRVIDQSDVEGTVILTPIQHYFFKDSPVKVYEYYNQSVLLSSKDRIDVDILERSISSLVSHHDALRMVYLNKSGEWVQENQEVSDSAYSIDFYDLSKEEDALATMSRLGSELQSSIDLSSGPLFKVGHFRLPEGDRLALIIHHLVVDGVSWRILLEDLSALYSGYISDKAVVLPKKTDSFQRWALLQHEYSQKLAKSEERMYWDTVCGSSITDFPIDKGTRDTVIQFNKRQSFVLDKSITEVLQTKVHGVYNTEINDVLLTGLGLAIRDVFGLDRSILKMEGHGREEVISDVDISRTVGWFTSIYPFVLDVSTTEKRSDSLVQVKESLRKVPNKGIGYGILKYLTDDFDGSISPSIVFNYLGDFGDSIGNSETSLFEYSSEDIGLSMAPSNGKDAILDISGMMTSGQLSLSIRYCDLLHDQATIARLISSYEDHLSILIGELSEEEQNHLTPSDLTFKALSIAELSELNMKRDVEDVYELSPLQQGMYYHWLSKSDTSLYFEQTSYRLRAESLDVDLIHQAYDELVKRHSVLRTSFTNDYGGTPLQVVRKDIPSNFSYEQAPEGLVGDALDAYVETMKLEDRSKGFDLEGGSSQMRLKVLDLGSGSYEFIWSFHHILMDGWCMSILINDFYELMGSIDQNREVNLPTPVRYSSYIDWLSKVNKEESLTYWREYLEGYDHISEVPCKIKDGDTSRYTERRNTLKIEGVLYDKVNTLCNDLGITQNTFIQGVWGYLLSRYNNTQDVVFGSVVSGRPADLSGVEDMIGLFSNTIPVRINYQSDDTPLNLLKSLQDESISSTSHHYLNLSEVQSESELGMDLINHIMIFENFPIQEAIKDDIEVNTQDDETEKSEIESVESFGQTNYDFIIVIVPKSSSLTVQFRCNTEVYEAEMMEALVSHFNNLVEQFVESKEQSLDTFDYLEERETNKLLNVFNDEVVQYSEDKTLLDLFEEQVLNNPDNIALVFEGEEFNYKELDEKSNQFANYLIDKYQIKLQDVIGVKLDRSEWLVKSLFAILKTGSAYIPIDPNYPKDRINYIESDSNCKLIIDKNVIQDFIKHQEQYGHNKIPSKVCSSDLAYIIYTSGSTGNPKGVMIEHKSLVNYLRWSKSYYGKYDLSGFDFGLYTSLSFDLTVTSLFLPLISGNTLTVFESNNNVLESLVNYLESDISCIKLTPAHISLLEGWDVKAKNLEMAIVGGEALHQNHINVLKNINPDIKIYNEYGPTEATVGCIVYDASSNQTEAEIKIGTPILNTNVYILDRFNITQPIGVIGEICLGGNGLARGYVNRAELTKEKFIDHPFVKGKRLYRTGDLGRWLPDGSIEYIGRVDHQVKIRGHRIELGEIEQKLLLKEDISDAVVLAVEAELKEKELVGYLVSKEDQNVSELRSFLSGLLPQYMIPRYFVQIEKIPLTINGKVDKKSLPDPKRVGLSTGIEYTAPKNEIEEKLLDILIKELGIEKEGIGTMDNFFDIGMNSIKLLKVLSIVNREFQIQIKPTALFEYPNISELVANVFYNSTEEDSEEEDMNAVQEFEEFIDLMEE